MRFVSRLGVASIIIFIVPLVAPALGDETGWAEALHAVRRERGRICMVDHFHFGVGEAAKKRLARKNAIADWRGFAAWEYGTDWGSFRRAASRAVRCKRASGLWTCSARARPCKSRKRRR